MKNLITFLNNGDKFQYMEYFKLTKEVNQNTLIYPHICINNNKVNINTSFAPIDVGQNKKINSSDFIEIDTYINKIRIRININNKIINTYDYLNKKNYIVKNINEKLYLYNIDYGIGGGNNFYHFFLHYLPKIYLYLSFINIFREKDIKLLINYNKLLSWQKDILTILGLKKKDIYQVCDKTILINSGINIIPNYPNISKGVPKFINIIRDYYETNILRNILNNNLNNNNLNNNNLNNNLNNIIIIRTIKHNKNISSGRHIINKNDILNITSPYNFIDIDHTKLNIKDSILLFYNAKNIIIEAGACCFNLIWTKPLTNIIVINSLDKTNNFSNVYGNIFKDKKISIINDNEPVKELHVSKINDKYYNQPYKFNGLQKLKNILDNSFI
jgi:hypothetical protein